MIVAIFVFAFLVHSLACLLIFPPKLIFLNELFFFPCSPSHYTKSCTVVASCLNYSGRYSIHDLNKNHSTLYLCNLSLRYHQLNAHKTKKRKMESNGYSQVPQQHQNRHLSNCRNINCGFVSHVLFEIPISCNI